jgi:Carboxypeptidase regulatory-like domain/TonB-dependent Receptor Plug Domain
MQHRKFIRLCAPIALALTVVFGLLLLPRAAAQVSTGTILGRASDPAGAAVAGAAVKVTNLGTGIVSETTTNARGLFTIPNLQAGHYSVSVSASGFSTVEAMDVVVDVGAEVQENMTLKVGQVSEKVVVTAATPAVNLESSTIQPVVNERTIVELPLNGRDWASLANLQPGVVPARTQPPVAVTNQRANRGVGNQLVVSGARPQMNNYRVDGISINDYSNGGPGGVNGGSLGVDAIQEFSVVTGNATADYGKTSGGVINAVTRTGSNAVHGSAYEFLRNSALDARNEFDKPGQIAPFRRNQFGASLGGPLIKDRTFLFGDYEGLRQYQSQNIASTVPSASARGGTLHGSNCPGGAAQCTVTVDAAVAPYLAFYPAGVATSNPDYNTYLFNDPATTSENYFTIRADHKISNSDALAATYFFDSGTITSADPFDVVRTGNVDKRQMASISESHTFSGTLLNTARFGYSRVVSQAPTTLGAINSLAADTSLGFMPGRNAGLINVAGLSNFQGGLNGVGEFDFHLNSFQFYDDFYWTRGVHSFKAGFSYERLQNNQLGHFNPNGQYVFTSLSNFLTNQPFQFNGPLAQAIAPRDLRQSVIGAYFMDDYHVRQNLTLNLGLRYEIATVPTETAGRLSNLPTLTATTPKLGSPYFSNPTLRDFAPRVGLAYDPFHNGKTSIRAAYGIYDSLPLNYLYEGLSIFAAPFFQSGTVTNLAPGTFPTGGLGQLTPVTFRYSYTPQNPHRSYMQQWSLSVQRELPGEFTAQVGYQGSHGVHLPYREDDINTVQPMGMLNGMYEFPSLVNNTPGNTPNPKLNNALGQISSMIPIGYSEYSALQAQLTKRMTKSLQLQASYTWQKSIDDGSSSTFGDTFANSVSSLPYFAPDRRRAVSDFNIANNLVFNYFYFLPNVPKSFGPAGYVLNGWEWGGIFSVASGLPFTPLISGDPMGLRSADTFGFPDRSFSSACRGNAVNPQNKNNYIKTNCFTYPTETTNFNPFMGTSGRNSLFGPGLQNFDMSFFKNNHLRTLGENIDLQFRAEIFNIFNRVNYGTPLKSSTFMFAPPAAPKLVNGTYTGALDGSPISSAGRLTNTATSSRQTQFALKIIF